MESAQSLIKWNLSNTLPGTTSYSLQKKKLREKPGETQKDKLGAISRTSGSKINSFFLTPQLPLASLPENILNILYHIYFIAKMNPIYCRKMSVSTSLGKKNRDSSRMVNTRPFIHTGHH